MKGMLIDISWRASEDGRDRARTRAALHCVCVDTRPPSPPALQPNLLSKLSQPPTHAGNNHPRGI